MMKKKILYLDMAYHVKTGSSMFLIDLLKEYYDVEVEYYDAVLQVIRGIHEIMTKEYDFLVCWQVMPEDFILNSLNYKKGILFPMYDSVVAMPKENWERFRGFTIISFSKELYKYLLDNTFYVKYIQYFPEIHVVEQWGKKDSLFFWQRINQLDVNMIMELCANLGLKKIHIHRALDPGHDFVDIKSKYLYDIKYTCWFEKKEDMLDLIMQSAYYVAPRLYEGIGMSFLEAMALGRCVIAPNYSTMNEYIINGETGLLYDYENPLPLNHSDIDRIQKNAYEYMAEGYLKWKRKKYDIIEWIEEKNILKVENGKEADFRKKTERVDKLEAYFRIYNKWLKLKNCGKSIVDYFLLCKIQTIAIYGGGEVAQRLMEELEDSRIKISYIIDRNLKRVRCKFPVLGVNDDWPKVDAIVVTPVYAFGKIYMQLSERVNCKIISVDEIVNLEFYDSK